MALARNFVPEISPVGMYQPEEFDRTRAFVVLAHAEIEMFLERFCLAVLNRAHSQWLLDGRPRTALMAVLAFSRPEPVPSSKPHGQSSLLVAVDRARVDYGNRVFNNHGIRGGDVLSLVLPIGVRESELSSAWLIDMDTFGAQRGAVAHQSAAVQTPPDPRDTLDLVDRVLMGLWRLDYRRRQLTEE